MGAVIRINILGEISHGNHGAAFVLEILHILFEIFDVSTDPGMLDGRNAVKAEHGDLSVLGLIDRPFEVFHFPIRSCVACGGNKERIVDFGIIGLSLIHI